MPNLSLAIGQLRITPFFWSLCLAFALSSFSFWRKLKEDYKEEEIYGASAFIVLSSLFFGWFSAYLIDRSRLSFPFAFLGAVAAVVLWSYRFKTNVWEMFDALALPLFNFLILGGIGQFLKSGNWWEFQYPLSAIISYMVFSYSKRRYRSFFWYKSGKIGFLFWQASLAVFFLLSVLAFFQGNALYWERFILILLFLLSAAVLYNHSERNFKEDIKRPFLKWLK